MKTNLEILIDELQSESDYLKKELDLCVVESDFKGAQAFQKSLIYTQQQLRIIKGIQNPNWDKIESLERNIERLKNSKEDDRIYKLLIRRLPEYQARLDELRSIQPRKHALESEEITSSLEGLLTGKIRKISLQISGDHDAQIHFNLNGKVLNLQLVVNTHFADKKRRHAILKNIGFEIQQDNMSMKIADFDQSKTSNVLEILAQIIYDVLDFRGNEKAKIITS